MSQLELNNLFSLLFSTSAFSFSTTTIFFFFLPLAASFFCFAITALKADRVQVILFFFSRSRFLHLLRFLVSFCHRFFLVFDFLYFFILL